MVQFEVWSYAFRTRILNFSQVAVIYTWEKFRNCSTGFKAGNMTTCALNKSGTSDIRRQLGFAFLKNIGNQLPF